MLALVTLGAPAVGFAKGTSRFTSAKRLERLQAKVGARHVPIEAPCAVPVPAGSPCARHALDRVMTRIRSGKTVRVLQLGDSHIASDYITGMIRHRLQKRLGNAGRGFVHVDQHEKFGGRKIRSAPRDWIKDRIVDTGREGRPYGFSGMSLTSKRAGARITYRLRKTDRIVRVYLESKTEDPLEVRVNRKRLEVSGTPPVIEVELPKLTRKTATLTLKAKKRDVAIYGVSFDGVGPGIIYESIGPVGADARVYLDLERETFKRHLAAHQPDLVVLMVGGNDALKVRKKWRTLEEVEGHYRSLIALLQKTLPEADIMVWSPMDAGDRRGREVVSKGRLTEIRSLQKRVVDASGVGYWDAMEAMGGPGSIARWNRARIMNKDLVHPRKEAADLLGSLFADAFLAILDERS